jgi:hypothetical protein
MLANPGRYFPHSRADGSPGPTMASGCLAGQSRMASDFDEMLAEIIDAMEKGRL